MSVEENKTLVRRYFDEVVNGRNFAVMDEIFAPSFASESIERSLVELLNAFPDLQATVEDIVAKGDKVVVRWTDRGTHRGEWKGINPTGKQMTLTGVATFRIADGKIVAGKGDADFSSLMQQLGAAPASVDDLPANIRQAYEQAMAVLRDSDQDGIPDILEGAIQVADLQRQEPSEDRMLRLKEAKEMLDAGLLTEEDYEATKAQILSEL